MEEGPRWVIEEEEGGRCSEDAEKEERGEEELCGLVGNVFVRRRVEEEEL